MTLPALLAPLLLTHVAVSTQAAVATAHPLASEAAAEVLRRGGNAADAAVAAAFALAVVEPMSSGIGGGGLALVYMAKEDRVYALDFRETGPAAAVPDMFLRGGTPVAALSRCGGLAVAVPGAVKGYAEIARRFGRKRLPELVEPAARLAEQGFQVGRRYRVAAEDAVACLQETPAAAKVFLAASAGASSAGAGYRARASDGGAGATGGSGGGAGHGAPRVPPDPGWLLVQRDLAKTLRALGRDPEAFYRGRIAERVAAAIQRRGGVLTKGDLGAYRIREREALWGTYRGHRIASFPPPSAGGAIVIGLLQALEGDDPRDAGYRPEPFLHAFIEVEKRLFARRAGAFGDPDFEPAADVVAREMVSPEFASRVRAEVGARATPSGTIEPSPPPGQTTHLSVVDAEGNAVALTSTVNLYFGSGVVVPGTGILLNDQMDDFDAAPGAPNAFGLQGTDANLPAPGKRPLSSMSPTLLFGRDGKLLLAVGSPGGSTIPSTVVWAIINVVDYRMPLDQALGAPRIHHQWRPDVVVVEPYGLEAETRRGLEARGHTFRDLAGPFGNPQAVRVDPSSGWREAASEPRGDGRAVAP